MIIMIMVMIVVMPPFPVLFLLVLVQVAEIAVLVTMGFYRPLIVENHFVVIPAVPIMVVRIVVVATTMLCAAACRGQRQCQGAGD